MLGGLGHEAVAQTVVHEQPFDHHAEVFGVAAVEAQADALPVRHDLPQAAGVGHDARAPRGHRLERHQPEGLVDRGHHAQVADAVQRVQHVVPDPAEEGAVLREPQARGLAAQLGLVGPAAGHQEADLADALDHAGEGIEGELEALLVDEPAHQQHEPLLGLGEAGPQAGRSPLGRSSAGSTPLGITDTRRSSIPKMSATCPRM